MHENTKIIIGLVIVLFLTLVSGYLTGESPVLVEKIKPSQISNSNGLKVLIEVTPVNKLENRGQYIPSVSKLGSYISVLASKDALYDVYQTKEGLNLVSNTKTVVVLGKKQEFFGEIKQDKEAGIYTLLVKK